MRSFNITSRRPSAQSSWRAPRVLCILTFVIASCGGANQQPKLTSTYPADAATGVPLNAKVSAVFDIAMAPLSAATLAFKQGGTSVAGVFSLSADGSTATFSPSANLAASSVFTATITSGAKSAAGGNFAADHSWTFTTGTTVAQPPALVATSPPDAATDVPLNARLSAQFDTAMNPLDATTFVLKQGPTSVAGSVSTSADGTNAKFAPATSLAANTVFTATITTGATSMPGLSLATDHSWSFTTGTTLDTSMPAVTGTSPDADETGVATNTKISATFSKAMDFATLSSATFSVKQGTALVPGAVTYGPANSVIFAATVPLAINTVYTATVAADVQDLVGNPLATAFTWSFTTGTTADTTAPFITGTIPDTNATNVAVNAKVIATFSEPMNALSLTAETFTVNQGNTKVLGTVTYGPGATATFAPATALPLGTLLTATLSTDVKDLQGNGLAQALSWSFTTGSTAALGPAPVGLGAAGNFVVLAKSQIDTVPGSMLTGDIGLSPAAASFITGFSLVEDSTNVFWTSTQVVGKAYAANNAPPTPSNLTTSVANMQTAYTDAAGRPTPDFLELGTGNIGGKTLAPGLYKWTSTITIPTDVTISGGANDVWIFQTSKDITMAANQHIILAGGALAKNIFWQVAGQVIIGTGAHVEGVLLCKTQVTLQTGATMNGRILAQTLVALQKATVTQPAH